MAAIRGLSLAKLSKVRVTFSSFDPNSVSARELFRRLSAARMRETNPKCQVVADIRGDGTAPAVDVVFEDGTSVQFEAGKMKALEVVAAINKKARTM